MAVKAGVVETIGSELDSSRATRIVDVHGFLVFPGIIDCHMHVSSPERWRGHPWPGAGVTTAVDFSGPMESTWEGMLRAGAGLILAGLEAIVPGHRPAKAEPGIDQLLEITEGFLARGGLGSKLPGGHRPASPEATARVIDAANQLGCYVPFHVDTTRTGSDLPGLLETIDLAGPNHLHIAHVNSYCRETATPPASEAATALEALAAASQLVSESYLGTTNGTGGFCVDGLPQSRVTRNCLKLRGYPPLKPAWRGHCPTDTPWLASCRAGRSGWCRGRMR